MKLRGCLKSSWLYLYTDRGAQLAVRPMENLYLSRFSRIGMRRDINGRLR